MEEFPKEKDKESGGGIEEKVKKYKELKKSYDSENAFLMQPDLIIPGGREGAGLFDEMRAKALEVKRLREEIGDERAEAADAELEIERVKKSE